MKKNEQTKQNSMVREIVSWAAYILGAIVLAFLINTFVGQRTVVDGRSMENTLHDGDNLICDKLSYRFSDPDRFDIVVIEPHEGDSDKWIKRIIGLPGETVRIDDEGRIYINGEILEEDYGKEVIQDSGMASQEIALGDDEYWVMGDNRNNSSDSRIIGPVGRSQIVGRAIFRIYPFDKFGRIKNGNGQ